VFSRNKNPNIQVFVKVSSTTDGSKTIPIANSEKFIK
jgi:hypothetical protein